MTAKKAPAPERHSAQAVELFEKGIKALGKRDYEKAQEHLTALLAAHAEERDVAERARLYLGLCRQKLEKKPAFKPKTLEEHLNYGILLHNRGNFGEALKVLNQAAELQPKNEHVLYCLAASSAQAGDVAATLTSLRAAIEACPASRAQARADSDFDPVRENEEFLEILDGDLG